MTKRQQRFHPHTIPAARAACKPVDGHFLPRQAARHQDFTCEIAKFGLRCPIKMKKMIAECMMIPFRS
ncbi:MAG: hypothetical protein ACD_54C00341G0001 [uncultured bacterium]|nr:MAG: hypothetical protein ACD_54C00341G0001 [uncultured bacterium]